MTQIQNFENLLKELESDRDYWRKVAEERKIEADDLREEMAEFALSSKDLESELEAHLEQSEKKCQELKSRLEKESREHEVLKKLIDRKNEEAHRLQEDITSLRAALQEKNTSLRRMEQVNDDLERNMRITLTSLSELESKMNEAIEKNVFLQSERDELMETVQRWRDESRDLHQELEVQRKGLQHMVQNHDDDHISENQNCMREDRGMQTEVSLNIAPVSSAHPPPLSGHLMSPSLRVSALNNVGDLMRTVGAVESRLAFIMNSSSHCSGVGLHTHHMSPTGKMSRLSHSNVPSVPHRIQGRTPLQSCNDNRVQFDSSVLVSSPASVPQSTAVSGAVSTA